MLFSGDKCIKASNVGGGSTERWNTNPVPGTPLPRAWPNDAAALPRSRSLSLGLRTKKQPRHAALPLAFAPANAFIPWLF